MVFFLMNLLLPAMVYVITHDPLVEVGVSSGCTNYNLSPVAVPQFNTFECLVLSVSISLVYSHYGSR